MKVIFLGTNGWYSTGTGNTPCILLDTKDCYVILDAGDGIYKIDKYIKREKPIYLFLSHFHLEHISGLHILDKFKFKQGIRIYGKHGIRNVIDTIANTPFTRPWNDLAYKISVEEIDEGEHDVPFPFECRLLPHGDPVMGYRLNLDRKAIAYCTDSGPDKNELKLASNADVFISECALKPGQTVDTTWKNNLHMNPETAARTAKETSAKRLILTHFDADNYKTIKERKEAESVARKIFKNTIAAIDGMELEI